MNMAEEYAPASLDVALCDPILACHEYLHLRFAEGSFIFVHDYNNKRFNGVREAVEQFLAHTKAPALRLPDFAGHFVLMR